MNKTFASIYDMYYDPTTFKKILNRYGGGVARTVKRHKIILNDNPFSLIKDGLNGLALLIGDKLEKENSQIVEVGFKTKRVLDYAYDIYGCSGGHGLPSCPKLEVYTNEEVPYIDRRFKYRFLDTIKEDKSGFNDSDLDFYNKIFNKEVSGEFNMLEFLNIIK